MWLGRADRRSSARPSVRQYSNSSQQTRQQDDYEGCERAIVAVVAERLPCWSCRLAIAFQVIVQATALLRYECLNKLPTYY